MDRKPAEFFAKFRLRQPCLFTFINNLDCATAPGFNHSRPEEYICQKFIPWFGGMPFFQIIYLNIWRQTTVIPEVQAIGRYLNLSMRTHIAAVNHRVNQCLTQSVFRKFHVVFSVYSFISDIRHQIFYTKNLHRFFHLLKKIAFNIICADNIDIVGKLANLDISGHVEFLWVLAKKQ